MSSLHDLRTTIARLRAPDGCPWDQEQTHASLVRCLIDEVSELIETIDRADMAHMREELGDVLIQVYFHAQIAEEAGHFDLEDVAREVNEKLVRRHPHVFGDHARLGSAGEVITKWEEIKAQEKKNGPPATGLFKPQPPRLPATMLAESIWKQVTKKSLPVPDETLRDAIDAKAATLDDATLGRELFILAAAARARGLDPEGALRRQSDQVMQDVEAAAQSNS
ncbi:MazG family protein [Actomonas aquatica]|uniref:MazG family protein n=1 Tax=Actomonas aquatica TaxID=2866162 RepID=A0ABZ1C9H6_9BACT|nr:MazG family protein [Opitutus sp. WL0086]WRQ88348.1 MazG family protein [Opitutus sp. WL0086]